MNLIKTISTVFFCLLIHFCIKGQNSLYFNKYYNIGFSKSSSPMLLSLEDTTYAILNYGLDSITGQQNMGIFKIDKNGNLLNKKNYDLGNNYLYYNNGFRYFLNANKSSLFVTSGAYINNKLNLCLTKINKQTLDTIKVHYFTDGLYNYNLSSTLKFNDNKYLLVGTKFDTNNLWPLIAEMDSNMVIKTTITCSNTQSLQPLSALINPVDKKLIMAGTKNEGSNSYGFIAKYDTLGNFIDSNICRGSISGFKKIVYSSMDNSFIAIGGKQTSPYGFNSMNRFLVCKYDHNLNLIWKKTYGKSNLSNFAQNAIVNTDGSILVVGLYSDSITNPVINKNYNGIMLKLRANGDSLWMKQFDNFSGPNNYFEGLYGIETSFDGGYIACGDVAYKPKSDAWVVKTDSSGCDLASCMPSGINDFFDNSTGINCYPNPSNGNFLIELTNNNSLSDYEILITDILGRQISSIMPTSNKIPIKDLKAGIYLIELRSKGLKLTSRKVVVSE